MSSKPLKAMDVNSNAITWWGDLSEAQKVMAKNEFEKFRLGNEKEKFPYPLVYDLRHLRLSQLGPKHITRIWVFRNRLAGVPQ